MRVWINLRKLPQQIIPNSTYRYMGGSRLWISTPGSNMWLHSFHAKIHAGAEEVAPFFHTVWLWLALAASGWLWLDVAGPWLALVGCPNHWGKLSQINDFLLFSMNY